MASSFILGLACAVSNYKGSSVPGDSGLARRGIDRVRIQVWILVWALGGGLVSWRDHGLPLATDLGAHEELAQRLGIELDHERKSRKRGLA